MHAIQELYKAIYANNAPLVLALLGSPECVLTFSNRLDIWDLKSILPHCQFLSSLHDSPELSDEYLSPLHYALKLQNASISNMLTQYYGYYRPDILTIPWKGEYPIHIASQNNFLDNIKLLILFYNVPCMLPSSIGSTPLHYAVQGGHIETMELLITYCPESVRIPNSKGVTPLHIAAYTPNIQIIELLLKYLRPSDINHTITDNQLTALSIAIKIGHRETVELLLQNSANPNYRTDTGPTPLEIAIYMGHTDIVSLLIGYRADITPKSIDIANLKGLSHITQLLTFMNSIEKAPEETKLDLIMKVRDADILTILGMRYPEVLPYTLSQIISITSPANDTDPQLLITPEECTEILSGLGLDLEALYSSLN